LEEQFKSLGFEESEIFAVWRVTAAVLHLGQIEFDGSTYNVNGSNCKIKNMDVFNKVAELLGF
jgi:chitin synthase